MTDRISQMTDAELDRALSRHRDLLAEFDHAHEVEPMSNYRRYLLNTIRRLEGERERRKHEDDEG
jgi:hypothetical protein